jgi:hypothetical protein
MIRHGYLINCTYRSEPKCLSESNLINLICTNPTEPIPTSRLSNSRRQNRTPGGRQLLAIRKTLNNLITEHNGTDDQRTSPWPSSNFINAKYHRWPSHSA